MAAKNLEQRYRRALHELLDTVIDQSPLSIPREDRQRNPDGEGTPYDDRWLRRELSEIAGFKRMLVEHWEKRYTARENSDGSYTLGIDERAREGYAVAYEAAQTLLAPDAKLNRFFVAELIRRGAPTPEQGIRSLLAYFGRDWPPDVVAGLTKAASKYSNVLAGGRRGGLSKRNVARDLEIAEAIKTARASGITLESFARSDAARRFNLTAEGLRKAQRRARRAKAGT